MTAARWRVLAVREGPAWSAQLLEHDLAAQGDTLPEALASLARTVAGQAELGPLVDIAPAPAEDAARWETGDSWGELDLGSGVAAVRWCSDKKG